MLVTTTVEGAIRSIRRVRDDASFRIAGAKAIESALNALPGFANPQVRGFAATDSVVSLDVVSPTRTGEVRQGDVIESGVSLKWARSPDEGLLVEQLFYRLACLNGLRHRESGVASRILRVSSGRHLYAVEDTVREAWVQLPARMGQLQRLPANRVGILASVFGAFSSVPSRLAPRVNAAWTEEGGERTEWGRLNALTRVATHATDLSEADRELLNRSAAAIAFGPSPTHVASPTALSGRRSFSFREFCREGLAPARSRSHFVNDSLRRTA